MIPKTEEVKIVSLFFSSLKNDGSFRKLPVDKILPNPMQPRKNFDRESIGSLASSIEKYGIIQPISVRINEGRYELVAGERRLRAAKMAGLSEIPCIIIRAEEKRSAEIALVENIQRCDLDIFEEAEAIEKLLNTSTCTQSVLAERLSMSQSALANKLRLLRFDAEQRTLIRKYKLSERHARTLLRVPPERRSELIKRVGTESLSVCAAEELVDRVLCTGLVKATLEKTEKSKEKMPSEPEKSPESVPEKPIRTVLIGDLGLFYNSLERSLSLLRCAGFEAELTRDEKQDEVLISIILKRTEKKDTRA